MTSRFAPSPTGFLHFGHAVSAIHAQRSGDMLLRIEDIDLTRCRPEFEQAIFEDLAWLGIEYPTPVMRQSERFLDYHNVLQELEAADLLYPCFCTRAEIRREVEAATNAPHGPDGPVYPGTCRSLSVLERTERRMMRESYALRLDMNEAVRRFPGLTWTDESAGKVIATPEVFGDVVLARKETPASYHLCVTIDDAEQGVDLVARGMDLFESTHVHRLLQAILGLPVPRYSHHPLVMGEDGKKLSKRDGAETLRAMRERGEEPGEIRNRILAFLG